MPFEFPGLTHHSRPGKIRLFTFSTSHQWGGQLMGNFIVIIWGRLERYFEQLKADINTY